MHPVERNDYVLFSNALEEWINLIVLWARGNLSGGITPGKQRAGKSFAMDYFKKHFKRWLGNAVGVVLVEVGVHSRTAEGRFFKDLLRSMGRPTTKHDPEVARELFVGRLVEAAASSALKKVVVLIDEAQRLDAFTLELLTSVHNDLIRIYRVRVLWVLAGQPELATLKQTLIAEGKKQLVARFMRDEFWFRSLDYVADVTTVIQCFDETLRYPGPDGPFFTEHYAPSPYRHGYRLTQDAPLIVQVLDDERSNNGLSDAGGLSMEGFVEVMNHILINQLPKLTVGERLTRDMILESTRSTTWLVNELSEALLNEEKGGAASKPTGEGTEAAA